MTEAAQAVNSPLSQWFPGAGVGAPAALNRPFSAPPAGRDRARSDSRQAHRRFRRGRPWSAFSARRAARPCFRGRLFMAVAGDQGAILLCHLAVQPGQFHIAADGALDCTGRLGAIKAGKGLSPIGTDERCHDAARNTHRLRAIHIGGHLIGRKHDRHAVFQPRKDAKFSAIGPAPFSIQSVSLSPACLPICCFNCAMALLLTALMPSWPMISGR